MLRQQSILEELSRIEAVELPDAQRQHAAATRALYQRLPWDWPAMAAPDGIPIPIAHTEMGDPVKDSFAQTYLRVQALVSRAEFLRRQLESAESIGTHADHLNALRLECLVALGGKARPKSLFSVLWENATDETRPRNPAGHRTTSFPELGDVFGAFGAESDTIRRNLNALDTEFSAAPRPVSRVRVCVSGSEAWITIDGNPPG